MINLKTIKQRRPKRVIRIRKKMIGTKDRPRMSFFRSNTTLYIQVIDDSHGKTLVSAKGVGKNKDAAKALAEHVLPILKSAHVKTVLFDRGGNKYHGVVKTFVEKVREGGIQV